MTCYLHIGMPKTGTTSIQTFLTENKNLLLQYNYLYPESILEWGHQHITLVWIIKLLRLNKKLLFLEKKYKQIMINFRKELKINSNKTILLSTEGLTWDFDNPIYIKILHKILKLFGFTTIKIIIYLRPQEDMLASLYSENIKGNYHIFNNSLSIKNNKLKHIFNYKYILKSYSYFFKKENIIVKIFHKDEFYKQNLIKDFIKILDIKWNNNFIIIDNQNQSLDLIGIELQKRLNNLGLGGYHNTNTLLNFSINHFYNKNIYFTPKKEYYLEYYNFFKSHNEWVRKEFFPHKERLFPEKDLSNYKENYKLIEMKPEYWDKIAEFIADIIKTKNEIIANKEQRIQNQNNQIHSLNETLQTNNEILTTKENLLYFQTQHGTAKQRIQNQLSYKLGQAMIINSKNVLNYILLPFILISIVISHKQEQKAYQFKIKKDPSLKLPPLETYPDYNEAMKFKNHLSYKLGKEFIKASKTWY
ncbi:hypothetical protein, partial [Campylobacter hepaticus]|uniref:hypothetical protein n=2 Tax=Campylobacter hepaticus TaxID=1813019 RepID=UPI0021AACAF5